MVNIWVAPTDYGWFDFLSKQGPLDEVNFWQPSGNRRFGAIREGELFVFKLKAPHNKIAGFGVFARASLLPLQLAWQTFGIRNGHPTLEDMRKSIGRYRKSGGEIIGFRVITQPAFWPESQWIDAPPNWAREITAGKRYSTDEVEGRRLWDALQSRPSVATAPDHGLREPVAAVFGEPRLVRPRLGQGAFRVGIIDIYNKRCVVTGEKTLPALEAAHILPVSEHGNHELANGLLLRRDLHALFDQHYVSIDEKMNFVVSRRIREEFENGREYYGLHGRKIADPVDAKHKPSVAALEKHRALFIG